MICYTVGLCIPDCRKDPLGVLSASEVVSFETWSQHLTLVGACAQFLSVNADHEKKRIHYSVVFSARMLAQVGLSCIWVTYRCVELWRKVCCQGGQRLAVRKNV